VQNLLPRVASVARQECVTVHVFPERSADIANSNDHSGNRRRAEQVLHMLAVQIVVQMQAAGR